MWLENLKPVLLHLLLLAAFAAFAAVPLGAQTVSDGGDKMAKVKILFDQGNFGEAVPLLEKLVKEDSDNADLRFLYGFALLMKSKSTTDAKVAKQMTTQALAEFVKAKELGKKEKVVDELIALLSENQVSGMGASSAPTDKQEKVYFSKNPEAEKLMHEAESYFVRADYDKAFELYQKALKIDPNLYEAALFSGDVFLQKGQFKDAETWYQAAIKINPNRETAYRYSATPLMKQGKHDQARERYIEAYITEPYSELARRGLTQWGQVTKTALGHPRFDIPEFKTDAKGKTSSTITLNPDAEDGSIAWIGYTATRTEWLEKKFAKTFPTEKTYRHTLREEAEALRSVIQIAKELKGKNKKLNSQFETLIKLDEEGLLESYILLAIPDDGIAQDHPEYLKQNRAKLREYVSKYVIGASKLYNVSEFSAAGKSFRHG